VSHIIIEENKVSLVMPHGTIRLSRNL